MEYHKILNVNWQPVADNMKQYVLDNPHLYKSGKGAWVNCDFNDVMKKVPSLQELFTPLGLTIKRVSLFVMNYKIGKIHIDDDAIHPFRVNFPVLNCKNTETRFYKVTDIPITEKQANKIAYHFFDPNKCELVNSFELDGAVIIRTQEPHQVVVHHASPPRISCTLAFYEDLEPLFNSLR